LIGDDSDASVPGSDTLYGEDGGDELIGAGGRDRMYGGSGNDWISTSDIYRGNFAGTDGVRDHVSCGPGTDTVRYEKGIDRVARNCENKEPH
jgi:Ca2+-binding RTX toxin-like protein